MEKIVIINHYGTTPDLPGPTRNYELADYLSKRCELGTEFWICGFSHYTGNNTGGVKRLRIQSTEKKAKLKIVKIKSTPYGKSSILRQINIMIFDLLTSIKLLFSSKVEAIILTTPPVSIFTAIVAKIKGIKVVLDVEDLWPLFLIDMGLKNKFAIKYMDICSKYLYKSSSAIAAVSNGMLKYVESYVNVKSKPLWLTPLGVNEEEYLGSTVDYSLVSDKEWRNDFIVMYIGSHGKANDIKSVLETIEYINSDDFDIPQSRRLSFVFIGDGTEKEKLIDYVNEKKLNNVYFEDSIPGNMVPQYLKIADVCLTNLQKIESFKLVRPNKLFQYMAVGKPIITGIWGEFKEIIEDVDSGIYVDFTKPKDASEKIISFLLDNEKRNECSQNGQKYISNEGNRKIIFNDFYENLLKLIMHQN